MKDEHTNVLPSNISPEPPITSEVLPLVNPSYLDILDKILADSWKVEKISNSKKNVFIALVAIFISLGSGLPFVYSASSASRPVAEEMLGLSADGILTEILAYALPVGGVSQNVLQTLYCVITTLSRLNKTPGDSNDAYFFDKKTKENTAKYKKYGLIALDIFLALGTALPFYKLSIPHKPNLWSYIGAVAAFISSFFVAYVGVRSLRGYCYNLFNNYVIKYNVHERQLSIARNATVDRLKFKLAYFNSLPLLEKLRLVDIYKHNLKQYKGKIFLALLVTLQYPNLKSVNGRLIDSSKLQAVIKTKPYLMAKISISLLMTSSVWGLVYFSGIAAKEELWDNIFLQVIAQTATAAAIGGLNLRGSWETIDGIDSLIEGRNTSISSSIHPWLFWMLVTTSWLLALLSGGTSALTNEVGGAFWMWIAYISTVVVNGYYSHCLINDFFQKPNLSCGDQREVLIFSNAISGLIEVYKDSPLKLTEEILSLENAEFDPELLKEHREYIKESIEQEAKKQKQSCLGKFRFFNENTGYKNLSDTDIISLEEMQLNEKILNPIEPHHSNLIKIIS